MAKILFITQGVPWPIEHGGALRIINLAKQLALYHDCYLLSFSNDDNLVSHVAGLNIFKGIKTTPNLKPRSWLRHVRVNDDRFYELSSPVEFKNTIDFVEGYIRDESMDIVIAMGIFVAEFAAKIRNVKKLLDDWDCRTLAAERDFQVYKSSMSAISKVKYLLDIYRIKNQESKITETFDLVTTISPVDAARIKQLNGAQGHASVMVLPNGVNNNLFTFTPPEEMPNTIAFWGNLEFPPNRTAIEFFCDEIFLPYLQPKGIKWFVIGKNPGQILQERAQHCPNIILTGFVEDLFALAGTIPVMVNPMVTGSGQKNKVLEAFMLSKGVVSTSMGMESFPVQDQEHCLIADEPKVFAEAVLDLLHDSAKRIAIGQAAKQLVIDHFTWEQVGVQLNSAVGQHLLGDS